MLDTPIRTRIDPVLNRIGIRLADLGVQANQVTWAGFVLGVVAAGAIWSHWMIVGMLLLLLSRLCDGLDGAVARVNTKSDIGGFLDIVLDFAFYGMIPLAFVLADPLYNGVAGAVLIFAFYFNGASFLTYALMAEKRGVEETARGSKSILYTVGLAEATETIGVFVLMCLFPSWFSVFAYVFAAIVIWTTFNRIILAYAAFTDE